VVYNAVCAWADVFYAMYVRTFSSTILLVKWLRVIYCMCCATLLTIACVRAWALGSQSRSKRR